MVLFPVLIRCEPPVLPEYLYKIAAVIETAFQADGGHRKVGGMQHLGSLFNTVAVHVI